MNNKVGSSLADNDGGIHFKPKLIVFDLDYTLWPFWVDTHVDPPFRKNGSANILDSRGRKIRCYEEVPSVLERLHAEGYTLAVASRTGEIEGAKQLLKLFGWEKYFKYKEIYPGSKVNHFKRFKSKSGYEFKDMLFFDDEYRNKVDLQKIGVLTIIADDGVTTKVVEEGLLQYRKMLN